MCFYVGKPAPFQHDKSHNIDEIGNGVYFGYQLRPVWHTIYGSVKSAKQNEDHHHKK